MKIGFSITVIMGIALLAIASNLSAGVPDSVAFQGQLTGPSGTVVPDGDYILILSLWTDSLGGSMIWSEDRPVTTKSGLFATCLGCVNPLSGVIGNQQLWLQTQIAGSSPLEPRVRISSVPSAMAAGGVHGDIETAPGMIVMGDSLTGTFARIQSGLAQAGSAIASGASRITNDCDDTESRLYLGHSQGGTVGPFRSATVSTNAVSSNILLDCDDDGDGLTDVGSSLSTSIAGVVLKSFFENGDIPTQSRLVDSIDENGVHCSVDITGQTGKEVDNAWESTIDGTSHVMMVDLDGDGVAERVKREDCDDTGVSSRMTFFDIFTEMSITDSVSAEGARMAINTKGTGAKRLSAGGDCDDADATLFADSDDDGDGIAENRLSIKAGTGTDGLSRAEMRCDTDSDDDGLADNSVVSSSQTGGARLAINSKGTSAKRLAAGGDCDDGDAVIFTDCDDDGDGIPESSVSQSSSSTGADFSMSTRIDGTPARISTNFTVGKQTQSASFGEKCDLDGDGNAENEISQAVTPTTSSVAIKTKGTGAEANRTVSVLSNTDVSGAVHRCEIDDDGDGVAESQLEQRCTVDSLVEVAEIGDGSSSSSIQSRTRLHELEAILRNIGLLQTTSSRQACDDTSANVTCMVDANNDGVAENSISQSSRTSGAALAIKTKGTGAQRVIGSTDDYSGTLLIDADDDGDGLADRQVTSSVDSDSAQMLAEGSGIQVLMKVKNKGVIRGNITVNNANRLVVDFDSDGDGYLDNSLGVGVDATHRIDVAGGAYCDGSNWVNASDARLKENFRPINGDQLLNKLEALAITQWNYKNGGDKATHIGPTAQEFYSAFGVGNDSLSISTIDPAGIALAAIKELSRRSRELDQKVERITELEAQINELKAIVTKLAAKGDI